MFPVHHIKWNWKRGTARPQWRLTVKAAEYNSLQVIRRGFLVRFAVHIGHLTVVTLLVGSPEQMPHDNPE